MKNKYLPNRKDVGIPLLFIGCYFLFAFIIGFIRHPQFDGNFLLLFSLLVLVFAWLWSLMFGTYISIEEKHLRIVKMMIIRNTIPWISIRSLKHKYTFGGAFHGINVYYMDQSGKEKVGIIPINIFKKREISEILNQIVERNHLIRVDHTTQNLMEVRK